MDLFYDDDGEEILLECMVEYDYLVLVFGSVINDFGMLGVVEYCYCLDLLD